MSSRRTGAARIAALLIGAAAFAFCAEPGRAQPPSPELDLGRPVFATDPATDHDRDGLVDQLELELARAFVPQLVFDSAEASRRPDEPRVVFQVRPVGCVGPGCPAPLVLDVRYAFLFRRDGGYGPDSWCSDSHNGDNQAASVSLSSADGRLFSVAAIENGIYRWPGRKVEWHDRRHVLIYMSGHKHHQFFDTSNDHRDSPYSKWGCNEDVNGRGARVLPGLVSPLPDGRPSNVGEPEAHDATRFIGSLAPYGYLGEHAWSDRNFTGGLPDEGSTSPMRSKWSTARFAISTALARTRATAGGAATPPTTRRPGTSGTLLGVPAGTGPAGLRVTGWTVSPPTRTAR